MNAGSALILPQTIDVPRENIISYPTLSFRPNVLRRGAQIRGHDHEFDHLHQTHRGAFQIDVLTPDGRRGTRIVRAEPEHPLFHAVKTACFHVPANWWHTITGLDDINESWCVYVPRNEAGKMIDYHPAEVDENYYIWITA